MQLKKQLKQLEIQKLFLRKENYQKQMMSL